MTARPVLDYDLSREEGHGDVLSIDIHGHISFEDVDLFFAEIERDPEEFTGLNWVTGRPVFPERGWDVQHLWRSAVHPQDCDDPKDCDGHDWDEWVYSTQPSDGAVAITSLAVSDTWSRRCYFHPEEWAMQGRPGSYTPVEVPVCEDGYVYLCRDCSVRMSERWAEWSRQRLDEFARRREAGVPERLVYA